MGQVAIRGHKTRGKEVIELLEMLGGINSHNLYGDENYAYYTIDGDEEIKGGIYVFGDEQLCHFTLEEFLEKFPYKVGDKVIDIKTDRIAEIYGAHWSVSNNCTYYDLKRPDNTSFVRSYKFLQPYKEKTMEEKVDASMAPVLQSEDYSGKRFGYKIPKGYEFDCIKENEIIIKPVKSQYPKTYGECHKLMVQWKEYDCNPNSELILSDAPIHDFCKIIVARNIYWKIAGEEMGLGKPWEPDWSTNDEVKYVIEVYRNNVRTNSQCYSNVTLAFPTKEMRDAFLENFKDLIEQCKELL